LRRFIILIIITILFYLFTSVSAQIVFLNPLRTKPLFNLEFQKEITTWNWQGRFLYSGYSRHDLHWQIDDRFQSNLLVPSREIHKWRDEHTLKGLFYLNRASSAGGLYIHSWILNDRQISNNNHYSNHAIGLFSSFRKDFFSITPYAGYQRSQNRTKVDMGWDVGAQTAVQNYDLGGYQTSFQWESDYDFYARRQNYENSLNAGVKTRFTRFSGDSLTFSFTEVSKQYYAGDSIEHVRIYNRDWNNLLFYNLSMRDLLSIRTRIQSKNITYFNGRNVFSMENFVRYSHMGNRSLLSLMMRTNEKTQDNAGIITDSRLRQTALGSQFIYHFNGDRFLDLDFSYIKVQYDTPDSIVNNDDRDEQRFVLSARYVHRLSDYLWMEWQSYVYLFHQMYLFKEQSANNSWNRVYKLQPRLRYRCGRISNQLLTEVLANYTVYDFEERLSQVRSFVFRKYTFADSATVRISGANYSGAYVRIEKEDKGSFFRKEFSQRLVQSYSSEFYNFFLINRRFMNFKISFGYNIYKRKEWRHLPVKRLARNIINQGPYISVINHAGKKLTFSAYASWSHLKDSSGQISTYTTGYVRFNYLL